jgi:hypothetical protein
VPAVAYAGGLALWRRTWGRLAGWGALILGPLVACALAFPGRVAGLAERFSLLQAYEFGWPIPALTAEGWLGMVRGPDLAPWDFYGVRWLLSAAGVGLLVWACIRAAQQRSRSLWVVLAMLLPVLGGYWLLQVRGARLGSNASYDAYKLFAVFYPVLLPGFCWWVTLRRSRRLHEWLFVVGVAGVVGAFNLAACGMFLWHMSRPPLRVDPDLVALRRIEAMPDVRAVNLLIPGCGPTRFCCGRGSTSKLIPTKRGATRPCAATGISRAASSRCACRGRPGARWRAASPWWTPANRGTCAWQRRKAGTASNPGPGRRCAGSGSAARRCCTSTTPTPAP